MKDTELNQPELEISDIVDAEDDNKPTNKIYDYFKVHPSLFVTVISALIAGISVFLNLITFLNANTYLKYFNIESNVYKQSTQFIYFMAIALAFSTILLLFQSFISKTFYAYLPYKKRLLLIRYTLNTLKKKQKLLIKDRKQIEKRFSKISNTNNRDENVQQIKKDLFTLKEQGNEIKSEYKSVIKSLRRLRIACSLIVGVSCLFTWIILCLICILLLSITTYDWEKTLKLATILSLTYVGACTVENWLFICSIPFKRKEIKNDVKLDINSRTLKYDKFHMFPLNSIIDGNIRDIFNDSNCKRIALTIVLCLFVLSFVSIYSGSQSALNKHEFFIVEIENQQYAIIYDNGENSIIEKVEISGVDLIINSNHQKIISSKNIDKLRCTFENVKIIRDPDRFDNNNSKVTTTKNNIEVN